MTHDAEFSRLEQFVERLMAGYNGLKAECADLQAQLGQLRQEKDALAETLDGLHQERQAVHSRVSGLIGRIEEWEKVFQPDEETNVATGQQARMFEMADPTDSEMPS